MIRANTIINAIELGISQNPTIITLEITEKKIIEGALEGKHILRNGRPVVIRLPVLPENFVYSDFVITGTSLYAAWEETSFYKIGRSGFLYVDLENTLYR